MSDLPFFNFYPDTFLTDTTFLSNEEVGVYIRLLSQMWINGGTLPEDDKKLARCASIDLRKWRKIYPNLQQYFISLEGGFITQKRLYHEYEKAQKKSKKNKENGRLGGLAKSKKKAENQGETPDIEEADEEAKALANGKANAIANGEANAKANGINSPPENDSERYSEHSSERGNIARASKPELKPKLNKKDSLRLGDVVDNFMTESGLTEEAHSLKSDIEVLFIQNNVPMPDDAHLLHEWINGGADPELDIKPTIKKILERIVRRNTAHPRSFAYFMEEIKKTIQKREG